MIENAPAQPTTRTKPPGTGAVGPFGVLLLVIGVVLALCNGALLVAPTPNPDRPECGGKVMAPGDKCVEFGGKNSGKTTTYEQEVQSARDGLAFQATFKAVTIPGAVVCFAGGIALLVVRSRRKRALAATAAGLSTAGPGTPGT